MASSISSKALIANLLKEDLSVKYRGVDGVVVGLEDNTDGKAHQELEKVYYAKIVDFDELKKAAVSMHQEQWSLKPEIDIPGCVRVRNTNKGESFILCCKAGKQEVEMETTEDMFNNFKAISNNGMIKERFEFPIDVESFANEEDKAAWKGLKWEVDVYFKEDGSYQEWCKIDLEVPSADTFKANVRPPFPIQLTEVMTGDRSKLNEEQTAFLNNLFDTIFITKNQNVSVGNESIATENSMSLRQVGSVEGIGELIKSVGNLFTGNKKKPEAHHKDGDLWTDENKAARIKIKDAVAKFYLNDNWLDKQEFVVGAVAAKGFSGDFALDGKLVDPFTNITKAASNFKQTTTQWVAALKPIDSKVQAIDAATKKASAKVPVGDDDALRAVWGKGAEQLAEVYKNIPWDKFPKQMASFTGNRKMIVDVDKAGNVIGLDSVVNPAVAGVDTLPALDKAGVKRAAQLIVDILENKTFDESALESFSWLDHSDGDKELARITNVADDIAEDYYDYFYHQSANHALTHPLIWAINDFELVRALERWIDLSIK